MKQMEKTADRMLEELNYTKINENNHNVTYYFTYPDISHSSIIIYKNDYSYSVNSYEKGEFRISPGLDKAIHKKIEELKNG